MERDMVEHSEREVPAVAETPERARPDVGRRAPRRTHSEKAQTAAETLRALEQRVPGLSDAIDRSAPALAAGDLVRAMREAAGLTQAELVEKSGVGQSTLSDIERGVGKEGPGFRTLSTLATACGMRIVAAPAVSPSKRKAPLEGLTAREVSLLEALGRGPRELLAASPSRKASIFKLGRIAGSIVEPSGDPLMQMSGYELINLVHAQSALINKITLGFDQDTPSEDDIVDTTNNG
jgi:transcriptional regulator with XRE-family HTH domain